MILLKSYNMKSIKLTIFSAQFSKGKYIYSRLKLCNHSPGIFHLLTLKFCAF